MIKKAPTAPQLAAIAFFFLSCFGLAVFLWTSFGGPTPLSAQRYTVKVPFNEAVQLATQAEARIAGVPVGKVEDLELPPQGGRALATISIDPEYAPIPSDTRATLRTKTLLGETYVELSPGSSDVPDLPEGGSLPRAQVAETVQLDEILRTFDPDTRKAFRTWLVESSRAIKGRGEALSNTFAHFEPTFSGFDEVFRTLGRQEAAVRQLFRQGAGVFEALSNRRGQLAGMIRSGSAVTQATAERDARIVELFRVFPTFLTESRATLERLRNFSRNADPLMQQLTPAAEELSPTLIEMGRLAPELRGFLAGLEPIIARADRAFPALQRILRNDLPVFLQALDPFLRNLNPFIEVVRMYRRELTALLGNAAAATNAVQSGTGKPYLRTLPVLGPDSAATMPARERSNRTNPYTKPGGHADLIAGLANFDIRQCTTGANYQLDLGAPLDPLFADRFPSAAEAQNFFDRLQRFAFGNQTETNDVPAPGCAKQGKFDPVGAPGAATDYQHVFEQPAP